MIKLPLDKELHVKAGLAISFLALIVFEALGWHWMWTVTAVLSAAILKEFYDLVSYGKFDDRDVLYTLLGGLPGIILSIIS